MPAPSSIDGFRPVSARSASRLNSPAPHRTTPSVPSIDGFGPIRSSIPTPNVASTQPPRTADISRTPIQHTKPHPFQKSKTLMRAAVKPPAAPFTRQVRIAPELHTPATPAHIAVSTGSSAPVTAVDYDRQRRAGNIAHSTLVQRFSPNNAAQAMSGAPTSGLPIQVAPSSAPTSRPTLAGRMPAPGLSAQNRPVTLQATTPRSDVFEQALAAATQPHQTTPPKKSTRLFGSRQIAVISFISVVIILVAGFIAFQNASAIQLHLTASRAGISAHLPTWQPGGFHIDTMTNSPGSLTLNYQNDASGQRYSLAESASSWDSSGLLSNFVYPNNKTYDTATSKDGTTVYLYGKGSATWVNNGIWYKLVTDGSLTTSQLVDVAAGTK